MIDSCPYSLDRSRSVALRNSTVAPCSGVGGKKQGLEEASTPSPCPPAVPHRLRGSPKNCHVPQAGCDTPTAPGAAWRGACLIPAMMSSTTAIT